MMNIFNKFADKFAPKSRPAQTVKTDDTTAELHGCIFEGESLRKLERWAETANPQQAVTMLCEILEKLNITSKISMVTSKEEHTKLVLVTEDGSFISLLKSGNLLTDNKFPHIAFYSNNREIEYSARRGGNTLQLERITHKSADGTEAHFHFPTQDNWACPLIKLVKGDRQLHVYGKIEDMNHSFSDNEKIHILLIELMKLELTENLAIKSVYSILANLAENYNIEYLHRSLNSFNFVWKVKIINGNVISYAKSILSNDKTAYLSITEVDDKNFRYETDFVNFSMKNGKFTFESSNPTPYEDVFNSCKAKIAVLNQEMEKLLD